MKIATQFGQTKKNVGEGLQLMDDGEEDDEDA